MRRTVMVMRKMVMTVMMRMTKMDMAVMMRMRKMITMLVAMVTMSDIPIPFQFC